MLQTPQDSLWILESTFAHLEEELEKLRETLREKENKMLTTGKQIFEAKTGWKFGQTVLCNPNSKAKVKVLLDRAELRNGEFTLIGVVLNKNGGVSNQTRVITLDYEKTT